MKRKPYSLAQVVSATCASDVLEWFNLGLYGLFAVYIAKTFFPESSDAALLLLTFASVGALFVARPFGAIVLGAYADRKGRKPAPLLTISMMWVGTLLTAAMPTYAQIGFAAPVGIFVAQLIQGFSAGREFGASTAMMTQHAPRHKGLVASFQFATQGLTVLVTAIAGFILTKTKNIDALASYEWRIPFLLGLTIGLVDLSLRRYLEEAGSFKEVEPATASLRAVFQTQESSGCDNWHPNCIYDGQLRSLLYSDVRHSRVETGRLNCVCCDGSVWCNIDLPDPAHRDALRQAQANSSDDRSGSPDTVHGVPRVQLSGGQHLNRRPLHSRRMAFSPEVDLLRAAFPTDGGTAPDVHASNGYVPELQHRCDCVRLLYANDYGVCCRQQEDEPLRVTTSCSLQS